jgi:hypothetical protein
MTMTNSDEIDLWRQIRILHEAQRRLEASVVALRKLAGESGLFDRLAELESQELSRTAAVHKEQIDAIDAKVRHLLGSA